MDPVVRWSLVMPTVLLAALLIVRVNLRLITRHPAVWARVSRPDRFAERGGLLWGDDHVRLGDTILSAMIWQARFGGLMSIVLALTLLGATSPRCVAMWI